MCSIEITTDFDGCFQLQEIRLADENIPGCDAELADLHLRKMDLLRRPAVLRIQKPSYDVVQNTLFHFRLCHPKKKKATLKP